MKSMHLSKKSIMACIVALMVVVIALLSTVSTPTASASEKQKKYSSKRGYITYYCTTHFTASYENGVDSFSLKGQDLSKDVPVAVSFEKSEYNLNDAIKGAKLQAGQDGIKISKGKFGAKNYKARSITYTKKDDPRGLVKQTIWAVQGKNAVYLVTITTGKSVSKSVQKDIETILNKFEEKTLSQAYKEKIKSLSKKTNVFSVQIACGSGSKILLVTPSVFDDGATTEVDVYQYVKGEVKYICKLSSGGTAYPVAFTKKALLVGGNHFAGKLEIKNGKAEYSVISNLNTVKKPVLTKYSVKNGKMTKVSSKTISKKKAESLNYYSDSKGNCKGEVIGF